MTEHVRDLELIEQDLARIAGLVPARLVRHVERARAEVLIVLATVTS